MKPLELKALLKDPQVGLAIYKTTLLLEEESVATSLAVDGGGPSCSLVSDLFSFALI